MGENRAEINGRGEQFEMLKALYNFKATFAKTLSFQENDIFILHQVNTKQRNWWQVVNSVGQVGYVPSNYVTAIQVSVECWVQFLDGCLEVLRGEGVQSGGCLATDRQDLLLRLLERRRKAELCSSNSGKRHAPLPPDFHVSISSSTSPKLRHAMASDGMAPDGISHLSPSGTSSNSAAVSSLRSAGSDAVVNQSSQRNSPKPQSSMPNHVTPGSLAARQVIHVTMSDTSHCRVNNIAEDRHHEMKKVSSVVSATVTALPTKSPLFEDSASSDARNDPGSSVAYQLVEKVRKHTQLSHEMSRVAVAVVVGGLCDLLPHSVTPQLNAMLLHLQGPLAAPKLFIEETHDAHRLRVIFTELTSCKEDSQQRSWMLYEDETTIIEYIQELISILTNADANISRHVMSGDKYHGVSSLVQYYQMEIRWSIRQLLLQAFGVMCSLDPTVVTLMLNSVLPMELARDMRTNPRDIPRLNYSSLLLSMIFSMGEPMPVTHMEHLGLDFVSFLFDLIECPPDTDVEEQIPDLFVNLVLAYNLQFAADVENVMLKALLQRPLAKSFTEKTLLLLNREGMVFCFGLL
ncbi:NCK-interacting protein with SH3 domain isoform X2 [Cryptotermes secundus]|uniref:NCK-interacting protein with SH3 domain isoform X2 n=1 Tax=Cryptotermes secundus TaxID=105785 RepID=UPI000CD7C291|nr:NCK-interacting protein with SH3 domain isoform X2 [Cryptotermes secundus]